jgi:hypothetical protein
VVPPFLRPCFLRIRYDQLQSRLRFFREKKRRKECCALQVQVSQLGACGQQRHLRRLKCEAKNAMCAAQMHKLPGVTSGRIGTPRTRSSLMCSCKVLYVSFPLIC